MGRPADANIQIDRVRGLVSRGGKSAPLTPKQIDIIEILLSAYPKPVTTGDLYDGLYALRPECDWPEVKIIDVMICHARRRFALNGVAIDVVSDWGGRRGLVVGTVPLMRARALA